MCSDTCFRDAQSITGEKNPPFLGFFKILVMNPLLISQTTKPLILKKELHLIELSNKQLVAYENTNIYDQLIYLNTRTKISIC